MCGTPAVAGDFCPTAGAATHSTCTKGADGCFTVMPGVACGAGQACIVTPATMVVPVNTACGCPPAIADQTGATVKLLGTGCTMAEATASKRVGSKADDAILTCTVVNACPIWQITTNCASQQLTGGTDAAIPTCVCKPPTIPTQYYVDPDPTMSTFMTGPPTGAQFPAACRLRTLKTALSKTGVKEVIAQHESSSNVHFKTIVAVPTGCLPDNSCETFPLTIPAGVHVFTSDQGSFNPAHYVIDVDGIAASAGGFAVTLQNGAIFEGYTIDASGTTPANAGALVTTMVQSPVTGVATATLNQILLIGKQPMLGVQISGQSVWTASYLSILGTAKGVVVDRTDASTAAIASLTATHLNIGPTAGAAGRSDVGLGVQVGGGTNATNDAAVVVKITNDATDLPTPPGADRSIRVGAAGTGVLVFGGTVSVTGVDIKSSLPTAGALIGYDIRNSTAQTGTAAAPVGGIIINQGSVWGAGLTGGTGILAKGGQTTVNGTHITGAESGTTAVPWIGVDIQSTSATVAGDVTLTGTAAAKTIIDTGYLALANATSTAGIRVGGNPVTAGAESATSATLARLTIADNTTVGGTGVAPANGGFMTGIMVNQGRAVSTGTGVLVTGNWQDGIDLFGTFNPGNQADAMGQGTFTGTTISNNKRLGVLVKDQVAATFNNVTVTGNGTSLPATTTTLVATSVMGGGIEVEQSQNVADTLRFLFTLAGSNVNANHGCGVAITGGMSLVGGLKRVCGVELTPLQGGKVAADIHGTTISGNLGVGLYVSEADNSAADDDITEVNLQSNTVTGNLTATFDATEPQAGGIYFAASDPDGVGGTAEDVGCNGGLCTRIRAEKILGNTISCNGKSRAQVGFTVPQRAALADAATAWDLGSAGMGSVDMAMVCSATALPNTINGYFVGTAPGLFVSTGLIHISAVGVHWKNMVPSAGSDFSSVLGATAGNGDANVPGSPGLAPGSKGFVACTPAAASCDAAN